jgi:hypothetical protein
MRAPSLLAPALLLALSLGACAVTPGSTPPIVLLGERHDSAADHHWQLATIERLYAADPRLVLGFEMFPRRAQPALDRWVAGQLTEAQFLAETDWAQVWGFDPALYLPIFRFARDNRIPMLALNVSSRLVRLTARGGWASVPQAEREGVGTPAPASAAYRQRLADAMAAPRPPASTASSTPSSSGTGRWPRRSPPSAAARRTARSWP